MSHPCLRCGACCAYFRVSFHWSETEPELGGTVPIALTEPLRQHERAMRGTSQAQPRCVALDAEIGVYSRCSIHPQRPSVCRAVPASWDPDAGEEARPSAQCDKARIAHGLPPLTAQDWPARAADAAGHPDMSLPMPEADAGIVFLQPEPTSGTTDTRRVFIDIAEADGPSFRDETDETALPPLGMPAVSDAVGQSSAVDTDAPGPH